MKVGVISPYSFPIGLAATNRIKAYSKALISQGVNVTVIIPEPREDHITTKPKQPNNGEFEKISYIFPSGRYKNKNKLIRGFSIKSKFRFFYGVYRTFCYLRNNRDFDYIIISNDKPIYLLLYSLIIKSSGSKSIFIYDEYPTPIRHKLKHDIPKWKKSAYRIILNKIDGYISITKKLSDFYCQFAEKPTFIMSVIVDQEKFTIDKKPKQDHITYMGNMELSKDNVDLIIKAFAKITNKFPNYTLHLYGNPSSTNRETLQNLIDESDLSDKVIIEKKVNNDEVPEILNSSKILVSSQPNTLRASGGFPTKLGEYLSTGVPTLITDVGENAKELVNMKDCIFVKPNDVDDYAAKLEWILHNYDKAIEIAKNGKEFINKQYSIQSIGFNLKKFLTKL